jgi:hypothetical protein
MVHHPAPKGKPIIDPLVNKYRIWPLIAPVSPDEVLTRNEHYCGPLFLKLTANCQRACPLTNAAAFVEFNFSRGVSFPYIIHLQLNEISEIFLLNPERCYCLLFPNYLC